MMRNSSSSVSSVLLGVDQPVLAARAAAPSRGRCPGRRPSRGSRRPSGRALALSVSRPASGLPCARRTSGGSMPWSIALRSRCTIGSPTSSSIERSSSTSFPSIVNSTGLPTDRAASRTRRGKRSNTCHTGTMRLVMISSCRSATRRDVCATVSASAGSSIEPVSCTSRPRVITSSPIRFIRLSSRRRSMRTLRC